ncbi:hypothetical protein GBF38_003401, partial [Nibea albiflora]
IFFNAILETSELDPNTTESLSVSQSSENDTSEIQMCCKRLNSPHQIVSFQSLSSESQSLEDTSEDKTSEESDSQSDEDNESNSMEETRDDSMGSEENVRKSFVREFASVIKVHSAEDNSTEVQDKQPTSTSTSFKQSTTTTQGQTNQLLVDNPTDSSDTTSDSADTSDITAVTAATSDSSESASSESNETSETSDSSDESSKSTESNASDSTELNQLNACVNGTQSCESEEDFFQEIGDDAHFSVDNLMVPEEDERELILRR